MAAALPTTATRWTSRQCGRPAARPFAPPPLLRRPPGRRRQRQCPFPLRLQRCSTLPSSQVARRPLTRAPWPRQRTTGRYPTLPAWPTWCFLARSNSRCAWRTVSATMRGRLRAAPQRQLLSWRQGWRPMASATGLACRTSGAASAPGARPPSWTSTTSPATCAWSAQWGCQRAIAPMWRSPLRRKCCCTCRTPTVPSVRRYSRCRPRAPA
mmetsp:Transcript_9188/g.28558  ORF Transcript_9188/g.28558 Transcript_9188/m.28558 type:complete len:211 (+) Transcript_9188:578-1210(+)